MKAKLNLKVMLFLALLAWGLAACSGEEPILIGSYSVQEEPKPLAILPQLGHGGADGAGDPLDRDGDGVADDDDRAEGEAASALHDLGDAADMHDAVLQIQPFRIDSFQTFLPVPSRKCALIVRIPSRIPGRRPPKP